ncbi:MAG: peptide-methionine (R)-S-oxide reductase MsrB [Candidatus Heimdallarchaeota archaeon]|nr:peptide-methionine (R)-S-oxide reductase MsrB [Candidatus Heimdallarchaeota archaeon]
MEKVNLSEEEWKNRLPLNRYQILRQKGTERPYTGELLHNKEKGLYKCAGCGNILFESETKYDSHCGWPSFYEAYKKWNIVEKRDTSHGMIRIEVVCAKCEGHLGHVFDDGPRDKTGIRYCINSLSLEFEKIN